MLLVTREVRISLAGEYDIANAGELSKRLQEAASAEDVTIDCTDLTYIDSSGLTALFRMQQSVQRAGVRLNLVGMRPHIRRLFSITGLESFFSFGDEG